MNKTWIKFNDNQINAIDASSNLLAPVISIDLSFVWFIGLD